MNRRVLAADEIADTERIGRGSVEADVSGHRRDAEDVQFLRRGQREENRDGVVDAGVAVDDDGAPVHADSSSVSDSRLALPPMATVLTLKVRSTAKRCR